MKHQHSFYPNKWSFLMQCSGKTCQYEKHARTGEIFPPYYAKRNKSRKGKR